jgi:hypothetical protein
VTKTSLLLSAVTIFPAWAWLFLAAPLLAVILRLRRGCARYVLACALAWLVFSDIRVRSRR